MGMKYSFDASPELARRSSAIFQRSASNFSIPSKMVSNHCLVFSPAAVARWSVRANSALIFQHLDDFMQLIG